MAPEMIVTNTPAKDLAYTNFAYVSPGDFRNFVVDGSSKAYALIGDVFVLSIAYPFYRARDSSLSFVAVDVFGVVICR